MEVAGEKLQAAASEESFPVLERMRAVCAAEGAGVEYLLLLFLRPTSFAHRHGVGPQRLLTHMLRCIEKDEEPLVFADGEIARSFATTVGKYVEKLTAIPRFGEKLYLSEPGEANGIGLLRAQIYTGGQLELCMGYLVTELQALALLPENETVRIVVASAETDTHLVDFALGIVSTTYAHSCVTKILRRRALKELQKTRANRIDEDNPSEIEQVLVSIRDMEGHWEYIFDEASQGGVAAAFGAPRLLYPGPLLPYAAGIETIVV